MSSQLPIKKIHLDSAFKESWSTSNSNCSIALRESFYFPEENTKLYLDDVSIPHSWYTVEVGINDVVYFLVDHDSIVTYTATLTSQNYTGDELATELATRINAAYGDTLVTAVYDFNSNTITVAMS